MSIKDELRADARAAGFGVSENMPENDGFDNEVDSLRAGYNAEVADMRGDFEATKSRQTRDFEASRAKFSGKFNNFREGAASSFSTKSTSMGEKESNNSKAEYEKVKKSMRDDFEKSKKKMQEESQREDNGVSVTRGIRVDDVSTDKEAKVQEAISRLNKSRQSEVVAASEGKAVGTSREEDKVHTTENGKVKYAISSDNKIYCSYTNLGVSDLVPKPVLKDGKYHFGTAVSSVPDFAYVESKKMIEKLVARKMVLDDLNKRESSGEKLSEAEERFRDVFSKTYEDELKKQGVVIENGQFKQEKPFINNLGYGSPTRMKNLRGQGIKNR